MSADRQMDTMDDEKPTTPVSATPVTQNQPDASPAHEPAADDGVKGAPAVNIAADVFTLVAFAALAVFTVGTCIVWVFKYTPTESEKYTLWQQDFANVTEYTFNTRVEDFACDEKMHYFRGAEAFALLSIFTSAIMVLLGILARTGRVGLKGPGGFFAFLTFAFSLVAWAIAIAAYYKEFCNQESFKRRRYEIGPGAGLFVTGWVFSFIAFIVALANPTIPKTLLESHTNAFASTVFGLFAVPALVFAVIAAPIPLFYAWTTQNSQTEATSYHLHYYVNDQQVSKQTWGSLQCGNLESVARASQAFAIITILASAAVVFCGYRFYTNAAPNARRVALIAALIATVAAVIKFAADMSLYYIRYCDTPSLQARGFQIGAGFALSTTVWVLHMANVLLLTIVIVSQKLFKGTLDIKHRWAGIIFVVFTFVSLLLCVLGASQTILYLEKDVNTVRYFWWNYQATIGGNMLQRSKDYPCTELKDLMLAGGSLLIVAIAVLCFTAILAVGQFFNGVLRKPASMLALVASVPMLIAWAIGVAVYWGNYCGVTPYNSSYVIGHGLGFVIAAWATTLVVSVLNYFVY